MTKVKKKRTKTYSGADAASTPPTIRRFEAVERNKLSQWWHEQKRIVKPLAIAGIVIVLIVWLIAEGIRIIF